MIIRGYLQCEECGHAHIVRIGMGQETKQRHQFPCRSCQEPIEVGLDVDYTAISAKLFYGKNAIEISSPLEGAIVNLDANYPIPDEDQGKENAFPRLAQSAAVVEKVIADRRARGLPDFPEVDSIPTRKRPDFAAEWNALRAAWSLARNGKDALSKNRIEKASQIYYSDDPLSDLSDWVWRFTSALSGIRYQALFESGVEQIKEAKNNEDFGRFCATFTKDISVRHGRVFFEILKSYFIAFNEFSQVQFLVVNGLSFDEKEVASSDFDTVRMFYGNAFEAFSSLAEFFAYLNNLISGRKFDEFASMTREKYLQLDKASRFRCFDKNQSFTNICAEADNVLRNASHHGGLVFDAKTQAISYRAGKGGQGDEQSISYTAYLKRCAEIFMQTMVLFRLELILANRAELRSPL